MDCESLNVELAARAQKLRDRLVQHQVNESRDINKRFGLLAREEGERGYVPERERERERFGLRGAERESRR